MYERRGGSAFGAFLFGGLIGVIVGLLFAPRTGEETRQMLTERANDYWGQAGDLYSTGVERVGEAVDAGADVATERSEQLRTKIDEARSRLQEQVAKSAEVAKDRLDEAAPVVKDAVDKAAEGTKFGVDKAAEGTKSGLDFAHGKASEGLDFVAKKAGSDAGGSEAADAAVDVPEV